jgi:hypothetical protein
LHAWKRFFKLKIWQQNKFFKKCKICPKPLNINFKLHNISMQTNQQEQSVIERRTTSNGSQSTHQQSPESESSEVPKFWKMIGNKKRIMGEEGMVWICNNKLVKINTNEQYLCE